MIIIAAVVVAVGVAGLFGWRAATAMPGDGSPEAGFARDMSTHHDQAVAMALLARDETRDPRIKTLATDIILTQQGQIGQMKGWLDVWGLPTTGKAAPMAWMDHPADAPMPGMASPREMADLSRLSGEAADQEFLRLMIRHHQGALPMAQAVLERSNNEVVRRLATSMIQSQQAEIRVMQDLLASKEESGRARDGRANGSAEVTAA